MHRDIKCENVCVNIFPFEVALIDFNSANPLNDKTDGVEKGTPGFFPPKQLWFAGDKRWDYYAFGVMVFEVLSKVDISNYESRAMQAKGFIIQKVNSKEYGRHAAKVLDMLVVSCDEWTGGYLFEIEEALSKLDTP